MYFFLQFPPRPSTSFFFFFNDTATTEIYTLSLHDALPISLGFFASVRSTLEYDPSTSGRCAPERWKSTANPVCEWHASQGSPEARLGVQRSWGSHGGSTVCEIGRAHV